MNFSGRSRIWLAASLGAAQLVCQPALLAQAPAPSTPALSTPEATSGSSTNQPVGKCPVDTFRELLAMNPIERRQFLASRPVEVQKPLRAKLREYESLSPNQRELRLKVTELYYYLWPLMNTAATNRAAQWALVPERDRQEIAERLNDWDNLPARSKLELMRLEATLRYFAKLQSGPPPLPETSSARQEKLEAGLRQWRALSEGQKQKLLARFERFFQLSDDERAHALGTLSEPERGQIEKTLARFKDLTPADRIRCLEAFQEFANLTLEERQKFLKDAERWKSMSPQDRAKWREVVDTMPPLPPGFRASFPPMPPGLEAYLPPAQPAPAANRD